MMQAAVYRSFGGPIQVETIPRPRAPADGVVIQVKATGVCRSDWHGWKGHDSDIADHGLPFVPGHEVSGIVVEVGPNVRKISIGDRVAVPFILSCGCCRECDPAGRNRPTICERQEQPGFTMMGSFAEYLALPRADRNLSVIPKHVSFVEAAALGCRFTTAYRAVVQQGNISAQKTVAVFGVGGLGLSCVMIAAASKKSELRIIAIDVNDKALQKAKDVGATDIVNAKKTTDVRKRILELTNGMGADLTIDAAGFKQTCEDAVWTTRRGGRMVQVGLPIGGQDPLIPMGLVAGKEIEIFGSHGCAAEDMPDLLNLVASGRLNPKALVEREVGLAEGAKAIMDMDNGSPIGITMVTFHDDEDVIGVSVSSNERSRL